MKRIYVVGNPHSGTTILRKIIGDHPDLFDITQEVRLPSQKQESLKTPNGYQQGNKGFVCKCPLVDIRSEEFLKETEGLHVIGIIKDIRDVAVSMRERDEKYTVQRVISDWTKINMMLDRLNESSKSPFKMVTYEKTFPEDKQIEKFREIFEWLGLDFDEKLLTESHLRPKKINSHVPTEKNPGRKNQGDFRAWQTSQPVKDLSGRYKTLLSQEDQDLIMSNEQVRYLLEKYVL